MRRSLLTGVDKRSGIAPWIVAGALLIGASATATAQEATPAVVEPGAEVTAPQTATDDTGDATGGVGAAAPTTVPRTGVGPGALGGYGPLALGATIGAAAAAAAALRQRLGAR